MGSTYPHSRRKLLQKSENSRPNMRNSVRHLNVVMVTRPFSLSLAPFTMKEKNIGINPQLILRNSYLPEGMACGMDLLSAQLQYILNNCPSIYGQLSNSDLLCVREREIVGERNRQCSELFFTHCHVGRSSMHNPERSH